MTTSQQIRTHAANGMTNAQIAAIVGVSVAHARTVRNRDAKRETAPKQVVVSAFRTAETAQHIVETIGNAETETQQIEKLKAFMETPAANVLPGVSPRSWPLWLCLALSMGCSIPNMLWVAHQLKADITQAYLVTLAFTVAPFLLLYYGVSKWLKWVPYVPISAEILCNAAGFYGGLTGLGQSLYIKPTTFLHMFTTMVNSGNEGTALLLSGFFAVCIALLAIVPVIELEKRNK